MRSYAMLITARDKVRHIADCVKSAYAQVGPPIQIVLSDQGSVDGTRQVLDDLAAGYRGPHKVVRLNCPRTEVRGMAGLNEHINWCMDHIEADVVMQLSADDYDLAQRSQLTIEAFEAHNPSMVLGAMYYVNEKMVYQGNTPDPDETKPNTDGWVTADQIFKRFVGGSTCQAWSREFWEKIGPLEGVASPDVVLPFLAVLDKGAWYVHKPMHAYRQVADLENTGLQGVLDALPVDDPRRLQTEELAHFQVSAGHYTTLRKMLDAGLSTDEAQRALAEAAMDRHASWTHVREKMSMMRIAPVGMKV